MLSTASSSKQVAVNTSRETGKEPGPTSSGWGVVLRHPSEPSKPTDRQAAPGPAGNPPFILNPWEESIPG